MKILSATLWKLNDTAMVDTDIQRVYTGQASPAEAVGFDLAGTYVGTISFEATIDDVTYFPAPAFPQGTSGLLSGAVTSTTATGRWMMPAVGYSRVRVRMSAYTSGSVAVAAALTAANLNLYLLRELMIMNDILVQGLNLKIDLDTEYRKDPTYGILP